MKRYEEAIERLPHGRINERDDIKGELAWCLSPAGEEDPHDLAEHLLKAAFICLNRWREEEDFAREVIKAEKTCDYENLDNFQKAVYHLLSYCPYEDGKFDMDGIFASWPTMPESRDMALWKHKLNV